MVEIESWGFEDVFGLPLEEAGLGASSTVEATGLRGIGSILKCDGGTASVAVLGRRLGTGSVGVEPRELGFAKKDVSTLSLDFLLCSFFAPDSSSPTVSTEPVLATEEPPGDLTSFSLEEFESRLCTEGSERSEGRLLLEERDDLLSGMLGRWVCMMRERRPSSLVRGQSDASKQAHRDGQRHRLKTVQEQKQKQEQEQQQQHY